MPALYVLTAVGLLRGELAHQDQPEIGFVPMRANPGLMMPTRADVAADGLRMGTRVLMLNRIQIPPGGTIVTHEVAGMKVGDVNKLTVQRGDGREVVDVLVVAHSWRTSLYGWHLRLFLPALYVGIALLAFARRPYEPTAWGFLAGGCIVAAWLTGGAELAPMPLAALGALAAAVPLHLAVVYPAPLDVLARAPARAFLAYVPALVPFAASTYTVSRGGSPSQGPALAALLSLSIVGAGVFVVRCGLAAGRPRRALVAQRARLLLVALSLGVGPLAYVMVIRVNFATLWSVPDEALLYATVLLVLVLADGAARHHLIDMRVAIRRMVAFAMGLAALGLATAAATHFARPVLIRQEVTPPAGLSALIFLMLLAPVVVSWPQISRRLDEWLHPGRVRLPELRRKISAALGACTDPDEVLEELAAAPVQVGSTDTGAAFLLAGVSGPRTRLLCSGNLEYRGSDRLSREPVVRLLMARQRPITRDSVHVDPETAPVADNLLGGFDRLGADVLLPIVHGTEVVGGLAVGHHRNGRAHDRAELQMLSGLAQHALQVILHPAPTGGAPADAPTASRERSRAEITTDPDEEARESVQPLALPDIPSAITGTRYTVIRPLGEGGYKRVYLAQDRVLDRPVALAVLKPEALVSEGRRRVQREAQAMAQLGDHPHIVNVYDMGEVDGHVFLVNQYMGGGSLKAHLALMQGKGLPLRDVVRVTDQICRALHHAHRHGIVHRDLKLANIWLSGAGDTDRSLPGWRGADSAFAASAKTDAGRTPVLRGVAKLGDFGLAFRRDLSRLTEEGVLMGTVAYMAPEQLRGELPAPSWDLYSLGVVMYEIATGRRPFTGELPVAIAHQHLTKAPQRPSALNPDIPPGLEQLILQLLAKHAKDRPQTAVDVRHVLLNIQP